MTKTHMSLKPLKTIFTLLIACLVTITSACMPVGDERINTDLFKSKEDMRAKSLSLKRGMDKKNAFDTVGVEPEKYEQMSLEDIQYALYGNSQVRGTPAELEEFRRKLSNYEGYALPYRDIEKKSSFAFVKMNVKRTGADLRMVMIFENDRLIRSVVVGKPKVEENTGDYFWDDIFSRGVRAAM
jgi:hypothetical protein